jgi:hypothetical protein
VLGREAMTRVFALLVRRQRPRPPAWPRPLDPVALKPWREDGIRRHVKPVDPRRTLRLGLDLEA